MNTQAAVTYETKRSVAQITFNRPEQRNSMGKETMAAFETVIQQALEDKTSRCVIITGKDGHFCSGADFKGDLFEMKDTLPHEYLYSTYKPFLKLLQLDVPVIAAMNGHAIGGGLGMSLVCDMRIASEESLYGANFARLGFHSGMGISYTLPRLIGLPKAMELLMTGRLIKGKQAAEIGLVNDAVPQQDVLEKAWTLAEEIAANAPLTVRMMKRSVMQGLNLEIEKAAEWEAKNQAITFTTEDSKEGIDALLTKRKPHFTGQ
ncbi:MAG TPA: enoyl-CoA hydratase [Gammaproteobacteria bacterium]|nr:enoyl-CoA hydratase [Gammaproteobacteria bacterium]